jgi:hypothetical protein
MRRDPRPFVVEVRRGPKKTPSAPAPSPFVDRSSDDDLMRRAEEALFGKPEPFAETAMGGESTSFANDQQPQRRILQAIVPDAEIVEPAMPLDSEPKRRGRKPGSKNRPKAEVEIEVEASTGKRRRGRPRKHPEGEVRSVEVTPELASAALEVMARAVPPAPAPSVTAERPAPVVRPEGKRPRGRPRKHPLPAATASAEEAPAAILAPGAMSATRIINRHASEDRPHAGRRWMRRLRGYAHPDHVSRRLSRP